MERVIKDKYEISIWEDVLVEAESDSNELDYYKEQKVAVIGADGHNSPQMAYNSKLSKNVKGTSTLTFTINSRYYDEEQGKLVDNPFLSLLTNERKIKLYFRDEWYDLIIKNRQENSKDKSFVYTATDLYINELSKNGFKFELDTELENNQGTAQELAAQILEETDWEVNLENSDIIVETKIEPIYQVTLSKDIRVKIAANGYLPVDIDFVDMTDQDISSINSGEEVYLFYSDLMEKNKTPMILYRTDGIYTSNDNEDIIINAYNYLVLEENDVEYSNSDIPIPNFITGSLALETNYRARKVIRSPLTGYDALLDKFITYFIKRLYTKSYVLTTDDFPLNGKQYYDKDGIELTIGTSKLFNQGTDYYEEVYTEFLGEEVDSETDYFVKTSDGYETFTNDDFEKLKGYIETEYLSPTLVQNYLANSSNFKSVNGGWLFDGAPSDGSRAGEYTNRLDDPTIDEPEKDGTTGMVILNLSDDINYYKSISGSYIYTNYDYVEEVVTTFKPNRRYFQLINEVYVEADLGETPSGIYYVFKPSGTMHYISFEDLGNLWIESITRDYLDRKYKNSDYSDYNDNNWIDKEASVEEIKSIYDFVQQPTDIDEFIIQLNELISSVRKWSDYNNESKFELFNGVDIFGFKKRRILNKIEELNNIGSRIEIEQLEDIEEQLENVTTIFEDIVAQTDFKDRDLTISILSSKESTDFTDLISQLTIIKDAIEEGTNQNIIINIINQLINIKTSIKTFWGALSNKNNILDKIGQITDLLNNYNSDNDDIISDCIDDLYSYGLSEQTRFYFYLLFNRKEFYNNVTNALVILNSLPTTTNITSFISNFINEFYGASSTVLSSNTYIIYYNSLNTLITTLVNYIDSNKILLEEDKVFSEFTSYLKSFTVIYHLEASERININTYADNLIALQKSLLSVLLPSQFIDFTNDRRYEGHKRRALNNGFAGNRVTIDKLIKGEEYVLATSLGKYYDGEDAPSYTQKDNFTYGEVINDYFTFSKSSGVGDFKLLQDDYTTLSNGDTVCGWMVPMQGYITPEDGYTGIIYNLIAQEITPNNYKTFFVREDSTEIETSRYFPTEIETDSYLLVRSGSLKKNIVDTYVKKIDYRLVNINGSAGIDRVLLKNGNFKMLTQYNLQDAQLFRKSDTIIQKENSVIINYRKAEESSSSQVVYKESFRPEVVNKKVFSLYDYTKEFPNLFVFTPDDNGDYVHIISREVIEQTSPKWYQFWTSEANFNKVYREFIDGKDELEGDKPHYFKKFNKQMDYDFKESELGDEHLGTWKQYYQRYSLTRAIFYDHNELRKDINYWTFNPCEDGSERYIYYKNVSTTKYLFAPKLSYNTTTNAMEGNTQPDTEYNISASYTNGIFTLETTTSIPVINIERAYSAFINEVDSIRIPYTMKKLNTEPVVGRDWIWTSPNGFIEEGYYRLCNKQDLKIYRKWAIAEKADDLFGFWNLFKNGDPWNWNSDEPPFYHYEAIEATYSSAEPLYIYEIAGAIPKMLPFNVSAHGGKEKYYKNTYAGVASDIIEGNVEAFYQDGEIYRSYSSLSNNTIDVNYDGLKVSFCEYDYNGSIFKIEPENSTGDYADAYSTNHTEYLDFDCSRPIEGYYDVTISEAVKDGTGAIITPEIKERFIWWKAQVKNNYNLTDDLYNQIGTLFYTEEVGTKRYPFTNVQIFKYKKYKSNNLEKLYVFKNKFKEESGSLTATEKEELEDVFEQYFGYDEWDIFKEKINEEWTYEVIYSLLDELLVIDKYKRDFIKERLEYSSDSYQNTWENNKPVTDGTASNYTINLNYIEGSTTKLSTSTELTIIGASNFNQKTFEETLDIFIKQNLPSYLVEGEAYPYSIDNIVYQTFSSGTPTYTVNIYVKGATTNINLLVEYYFDNFFDAKNIFKKEETFNNVMVNVAMTQFDLANIIKLKEESNIFKYFYCTRIEGNLLTDTSLITNTNYKVKVFLQPKISTNAPADGQLANEENDTLLEQLWNGFCNLFKPRKSKNKDNNDIQEQALSPISNVPAGSYLFEDNLPIVQIVTTAINLTDIILDGNFTSEKQKIAFLYQNLLYLDERVKFITYVKQLGYINDDDLTLQSVNPFEIFESGNSDKVALLNNKILTGLKKDENKVESYIMVLPGEVPSNNDLIMSNYYLYNPELPGQDKIETLVYDYVGNNPFENGYNYWYDETCQKVRSIKGKESNYFNLIQSICETFECWAKFELEHWLNDGNNIDEESKYHTPGEVKMEEREIWINSEDSSDYYIDFKKYPNSHISNLEEEILSALDSFTPLAYALDQYKEVDIEEEDFDEDIYYIYDNNENKYIKATDDWNEYEQYYIRKTDSELESENIDKVSDATYDKKIIKVPIKKVTLKQYVGDIKYTGFRYGINLNSIQRTLDSNQLSSKVIIKSNSNKYGEDGFCSIQRASENPIKENSIYNFDYYIRQQMLDRAKLQEDLYSITDENIGYFIKLATINKDLDFLARSISKINETLDKINADYETYSISRDSATTNIEELANILFTNYNEIIDLPWIFNKSKQKVLVENKWSEIKTKVYEVIDNNNNTIEKREYLISAQSNVIEIPKYNDTLRKYFDEMDVFQIEYTKYAGLASKAKTQKEFYESKLKELYKLSDEMIRKKNALTILFMKKYYRFVQEGSWISENYMDDNLYYLDALAVVRTSAFPKVTYNIEVIDLQNIEEYNLYKFSCGDKTYMEDTEFFGRTSTGKPYQEEVIISQTDYSLDDPSQNKITVQNYKTQFEDLFQRIAAATQTLQFSSGAYNMAAAAINPTGLSSSVLQDGLNNSNLSISLMKNDSFFIDTNGIITTEPGNISNKIKISDGKILGSTDGGLTYEPLISAKGISPRLLANGLLNVSKIIIGSEDAPNFTWNKNGITAYDFNDDVINYSKFIRYDKYGFYGIKDYNYNNTQGTTSLNDGFIPNDLQSIYDNASFGLTWDGFFLNSGDNEGRVSISSEKDIRISTYDNSKWSDRIIIGRLSDSIDDEYYGIRIIDSSGNTVLNTDSDGRLYLRHKLNISHFTNQFNSIDNTTMPQTSVALGIVKAYKRNGSNYDTGIEIQEDYSSIDYLTKVLSIKSSSIRINDIPISQPFVDNQLKNLIEENENFALFDNGNLYAKNAWIEGTINASLIKTAIFEKDTVQVLGGQMIMRTSMMILEVLDDSQELGKEPNQYFSVVVEKTDDEWDIGKVCQINSNLGIENVIIVSIGDTLDGKKKLTLRRSGDNTETWDNISNLFISKLVNTPIVLLTYSGETVYAISINTSSNENSVLSGNEGSISVRQILVKVVDSSEEDVEGIIYNYSIITTSETELATLGNLGSDNGYGIKTSNGIFHGKLISTGNGNYSGIDSLSQIEEEGYTGIDSTTYEIPAEDLGEITIWAGAINSDKESVQKAPFRVDNKGNLFAQNAYIQGKLDATLGSYLGLFEIDSDGNLFTDTTIISANLISTPELKVDIINPKTTDGIITIPELEATTSILTPEVRIGTTESWVKPITNIYRRYHQGNGTINNHSAQIILNIQTLEDYAFRTVEHICIEETTANNAIYISSYYFVNNNLKVNLHCPGVINGNDVRIGVQIVHYKT